MTMIYATQEGRAHTPFVPRTHAALPDGWGKTRLLNLLDEIGRYVGLNATDIRVLRRIALKTRAEDYVTSLTSPICYERQIDMAKAVGLSCEQFRRVERKLHQLRFLRRDTAANGYRGGCSGPSGQRTHSGLSLEPLIEQLDVLLDAKARIDDMEEQAAHYRAEISIRRRRLTLFIAELGEHSFAAELVQLKAGWKRPRAISTLSALAEHFFELESLVEKAEAYLQCQREMTGAPVIGDRRHIHSTTDSKNESCSAPANADTQKRTAGKPADTDLSGASPNGSARCLEKSMWGEDSADKGEFVDSLTVAQMMDLASDDMRNYINHLDPGDRPRTIQDIHAAVQAMLRELEINQTAFDQARDVMGLKTALIAVIVIDRNRYHPKTPTRNPGGLLRSYTETFCRNKLNLGGAVHGIWKRET